MNMGSGLHGSAVKRMGTCIHEDLHATYNMLKYFGWEFDREGFFMTSRNPLHAN